MTKPNLRTVSTEAPPPRSPQRIALAAASERHAAMVRQIAAIAAAQQATNAAVSAAHRAVEAAAPAVEEAKVNAAEYLTASMLGTAGAAPLSVKDARAAVQDAEDALEAALATRAALEAQKKDAENSILFVKTALDDRLRDVVKAEAAATVQRLLKEAMAVEADLVARRVVLRHLLSESFVAEAELPAVRDFMRSNNLLPGTIGSTEYKRFDDHPAASPWREAHKALLQNADAPLPT